MRTKNCGVEELVRLGLPPSWSLENGKLVINDVSVKSPSRGLLDSFPFY